MTDKKKIIPIQMREAAHFKLKSLAAGLGITQGECLGMAVHAFDAGLFRLREMIGVSPMIGYYDPQLAHLYFEHIMGRISDGELQEELDDLRAKAVKEGQSK
jgi:hypothetical protein